MKTKIFVPIKFKITFFITILLALVSAFIFYYFPLKFEEENLFNLQQKTDAIAKLSAYEISSTLYLGNKTLLGEEIQKLLNDESIRYIIIKIADSIYYAHNKYIADLNNYANVNYKNIPQKWKIIKSFAPIAKSNEIIGDLYLGFSYSASFNRIVEFRTDIGKVSLALFLVGSVLAFIIGIIFTKPLNKIVNAVNDMKDGTLNESIEVNSHDEFGFLANSFNKMVENVASSKIEMDKIKRELEKRVRDRTLEFEGALKSLQNENKQRRTAEIEISNSLHEKEVLLKEIHHRVKNNLQIVSSLLFFQSKHINDPIMLDMFRDGQNRVKSMALIHEKLYQSGDLANIDFKQYVKKLTNFLFQSYGVNQTKIKLKNNVQQVKLGVDFAVPFGLIINELISNSLKHGFKDQDTGEIKIDMGYDENRKLILNISDNGIGMTKELNIEESDSLGLRLVQNLATQLNGTVTFLNNNGTTVKLVIPNPDPKRMR